MFGYIRPSVGRLTVADLNYYRAAYCGLCRRMGKICGSSSRLCLSYDMTFLLLLRAWLQGEKLIMKRAACSVNPISRKAAAGSSPAVDYAAAVSGIIADLKFEDDSRDEKGIRRAGARCARAVSSRWSVRASSLYPGLKEGIEERLAALYAEEDRCFRGESGNGADACASLFGEALSFVCSYGIEDQRMRAVASAAGKYVGRWDYLVDAADDMTEDARAGRFNALISAYGKAELGEEERLTVKCLLGAESGAAADAMYLADGSEGDPAAGRILDNILVRGLPETAELVLSGRYRKPSHSSIDSEAASSMPGPSGAAEDGRYNGD